jgi:hypothetical protein
MSVRIYSTLILAKLLLCTAASLAAEPTELDYVPGSSQKLCQLIGDRDVQTGKPTSNLSETKAGVAGTDLGFSFEHGGKVFFLFGDTHPRANLKRQDSEDAIASSNGKLQQNNCVALNFLTDPKDGGFNPTRIPGVANGAFNVPAGGLSANGKMYVYFTTGHTDQKLMGRSVLGVSSDQGFSFQKVYNFSSDKFINVAPVKEKKSVFLFGTGSFRKSDPYLSITTEDQITKKESLVFFAGLDTKTDAQTTKPIWSTFEKDAAPLFDQPALGELSVTHDESTKKWIMLYGQNETRGINLRTADQPWGPWSDPQIIFDPDRDHGYCTFMHRQVDATHPACDKIASPSTNSGGVYAPYLVRNLSEVHGDVLTIYYTMSTWEPYSVMLMKSDLRVK